MKDWKIVVVAYLAALLLLALTAMMGWYSRNDVKDCERVKVGGAIDIGTRCPR